jgi:hypothetical protein
MHSTSKEEITQCERAMGITCGSRILKRHSLGSWQRYIHVEMAHIALTCVTAGVVMIHDAR